VCLLKIEKVVWCDKDFLIEGTHDVREVKPVKLVADGHDELWLVHDLHLYAHATEEDVRLLRISAVGCQRVNELLDGGRCSHMRVEEEVDVAWNTCVVSLVEVLGDFLTREDYTRKSASYPSTLPKGVLKSGMYHHFTDDVSLWVPVDDVLCLVFYKAHFFSTCHSKTSCVLRTSQSLRRVVHIHTQIDAVQSVVKKMMKGIHCLPCSLKSSHMTLSPKQFRTSSIMRSPVEC
jgi:hypothetical protein